MDLFSAVANNDEYTLVQLLQQGVDINQRAAEDGSTPLHYAASTGNLSIMRILLEHPNIVIEAQNNEGNTPLHVATAYTHLQAIKLLLRAGPKPHSINVTNSKAKRPIDYAWNLEVKMCLEDYQKIFTEIFAMNDDPQYLKKYIVDLYVEAFEFQEKCKETLLQLIEQKHVALQKAMLLEQAAGIKDVESSQNYIMQLSYLQDINERQTADIAYLKHKNQLLEGTIQQQSEELQQLQESRGQKAPENASDDLMRLEKFEEERRRQDEKDEQSGSVVFVKGEGGAKHLKGGTKEKLVERLTAYGSNFDLQYLQAFLLTYRAFMKPVELFNLIAYQYESTQAVPVRLRVCNTIKYWMENYWFDYKEDKQLFQSLQDFIKTKMEAQPKLAQQLTRVLERKASGQDDIIGAQINPANCPKPNIISTGKKSIRRETSEAISKLSRSGSVLKAPPQQAQLSASLDRPKSLSVANLEKLKSRILKPTNAQDVASTPGDLGVLDFDPLEIARQLTLIEFEMFRQIKPTEFLDQAWLRKDKETTAPGISSLTAWSNRVSKWVITEIVTSLESTKQRATVYERFVTVATHLEKLKNFNGVIEIMTSLQSSPVYRLKDTLANVNVKLRKTAEELMKECSSELNYKRLRARVHAADPPLIPFPGVYLQDLVFLDAGSKSYMDAEKTIINFQKHQTTARYIQELLGYQHSMYQLEAVPDIQEFLRSTYVIMSDDEHYNLSLQCEPRTS